jgi:hypothetical protein
MGAGDGAAFVSFPLNPRWTRDLTIARASNSVDSISQCKWHKITHCVYLRDEISCNRMLWPESLRKQQPGGLLDTKKSLAPVSRTSSRATSGASGGSSSGNDAVALDSIDLAIIQILQEDGGAAFTAIAKQLDISEGAVGNRVAQLTQSKALRIIGVADPIALSYDGFAMVASSSFRGRIRKRLPATQRSGQGHLRPRRRRTLRSQNRGHLQDARATRTNSWWVKFGTVREMNDTSKAFDCSILNELSDSGYRSSERRRA